MAFIQSGQTPDREERRQKMKKMMENMDRTKTTVRIPKHIMKKFKRKLLEENISANDFFNDIVLKFIE